MTTPVTPVTLSSLCLCCACRGYRECGPYHTHVACSQQEDRVVIRLSRPGMPGSVELNGQPLYRVRSVRVEAEVGHLPRVTLEILASDVTVEGATTGMDRVRVAVLPDDGR